jgi:tRNA threonylcarbamoyladenosine biosynthesis protein TsaB
MLLAIDTSTAQIGMALYDGYTVPAEFTCASGLHHTQELAPMLSRMLSQCGKTMGNVQALGVAIGPGSFTSLRVGLAFVKGLVLARHLPLIGVSTLDVVAASVPPSDPSTGSGHSKKLAAVLQAGRSRLALVWYHASESGWQAEGPAIGTTAEDLVEKIHKPVIVCGELTEDDRHRLARKFKNVTLASPAQCVRRPGILAEIAWARWQAGQVDTAASLAPVYLHVVGGPPA